MKFSSRRYQLPAYARSMTNDQIERVGPHYFMMRWEFYVAVVTFVLVATYLPWSMVTGWAFLESLVLVMTQVFSSVSEGDPELRHLPLEVSRTKWSVVDFVCGFLVFYKVVSQKPAVWLEVPNARLLGLAVFFGFCTIVFVPYFLFGDRMLWADETEWMPNEVGAVAGRTFEWWCLAFGASMLLSFMQELKRRFSVWRMVKRQGSGQGRV